VITIVCSMFIVLNDELNEVFTYAFSKGYFIFSGGSVHICDSTRNYI
jgi:hypothetical protein